VVTNTGSVSANENDPNSANNQSSVEVTVFRNGSEVLEEQSRSPGTHRLDTSFISFLGVEPLDGSAAGNVLVNDSQIGTTNNSSPLRHQLKGRRGRNTIEAYTITRLSAEGFWRFDFSGAQHFVAGSIRVEAGEVISSTAHSVVFRMSGRPGEAVKLSFLLEP
jgi:hypothetical protein